MQIVNPATRHRARITQRGLARLFIAILGMLFYGALMTVHVAAVQPSMQTMHGSDHSRSTTCVTLCTSTTPGSESPTFEHEEEDKKNKPDVSFQPDQAQIILALSVRHTEIARAATDFEPPPGLPAYILFSVFRP
jgi:hypothetical protein